MDFPSQCLLLSCIFCTCALATIWYSTWLFVKLNPPGLGNEVFCKKVWAYIAYGRNHLSKLKLILLCTISPILPLLSIPPAKTHFADFYTMYSLNIRNMQMLPLIITTPHSPFQFPRTRLSHLFPSFVSLSIFNPLRPVSTVHMLMAVGSSNGAWGNYQCPHRQRIVTIFCTFPRCYQSAVSAQHRASASPPDSTMLGFCAGHPRHCEFMCVTVTSHSEDNFRALLLTPPPPALTFFLLPLPWCAWALGWC